MLKIEFQQRQPESRGGKRALGNLKKYFLVWVVWCVFKIYFFQDEVLGCLLPFVLLFQGMVALNYTYLALFSFVNLMPILSFITHFLNKVCQGKNPMEFGILDFVLRIVELGIGLIGIRICLKCFQAFKAEQLGYTEKEVDMSTELEET